MRNQLTADRFLSKGVKEQEAVGSPTDETLQIALITQEPAPVRGGQPEDSLAG